MLVATASTVGSLTSARFSTPTSRARPRMLKQSARFAVRSTSIVTSLSSRRSSRTSIPSVVPSGSSRMPSDSTSIPSSEKEQSMPCDGTPRSFAFLIWSHQEVLRQLLLLLQLGQERQLRCTTYDVNSSSSPISIFVTCSFCLRLGADRTQPLYLL